MKLIVSFIAVLCMSTTFAQTQTNTPAPAVQHFAQCMFSISDQTQLDALTVEFYNSHPEVERVRFDMNTQRALVITTGLTAFTEADFTSWFGQYSSTVTCVQIGVYGVDVMNSYPFTNCQ
jgi:hypothetical protein